MCPLPELDDALGDEDDEEESDAVVTQVLDELGLQLTDELAGAAVPTGTVGTTVKATGGKQVKKTLPFQPAFFLRSPFFAFSGHCRRC